MKPDQGRPHYIAIDGMRGFAALAIVLYHFGLPGLNAGFLGVDIFFVISGFVISLKLMGELNRHGRIRFLDFYAGRIKRLLPSALAVGIVSLGHVDKLLIHNRAAAM